MFYKQIRKKSNMHYLKYFGKNLASISQEMCTKSVSLSV